MTELKNPVSWSSEFLEQSILRLNENVPRIRICIDALTENQIWQKPNMNSNCIGNLVIHLAGNITQYILATLGNQADHRNREAEFHNYVEIPSDQLFHSLFMVVDESSKVIARLSETELLKNYTVQCFQLTGIGIIMHVVEHLSYHTGQIVYYTKILTNKDLAFYAGQNLNQTNSH